eukprot:CAMPEP_0202074386 /NCGR_PEP_ID=MMETSP0964-20121228/3580_1 /ASSEMBLY_ACC=CAM_ASM_000500 /TAXON_ID=4773 /ORGANISM="Schizochytrium aggregatum, Strain ATCC28209" /LENGTH=197 /DNA_ID=CAMNT_0048641531 /DNA_START=76 /DNA_END=669 /DNA_ORIENTATION=-
MEEAPSSFLRAGAVLLLAVRCAWAALRCPRNPGGAGPPRAAREPMQFETLAASCGLHVAIGTPIAYTALVLFGAPLFEMWERTLDIACVLALLVAMPVALSTRAGSSLPSVLHAFVGVLVRLEWQTAEDLILVTQAHGAILGAWLGAIPIPLDWDRPWQAWPCTIAYGAYAGFMIGTVVGIVLAARHFPGHGQKKQR